MKLHNADIYLLSVVSQFKMIAFCMLICISYGFIYGKYLSKYIRYNDHLQLKFLPYDRLSRVEKIMNLKKTRIFTYTLFV